MPADCYPEQRTTARERPRRVSWAMLAVLVLGVAVVLAGTFGPTLRSPGHDIRGELRSAAADLHGSYGAFDDAALRRLHRHFRDHAATIDAEAWPQVAVTLHRLPLDTCRDATRAASRIEGLVVIELERYRSADDCGATNDMTWRLMP
jgi:hypothetical protein